MLFWRALVAKLHGVVKASFWRAQAEKHVEFVFACLGVARQLNLCITRPWLMWACTNALLRSDHGMPKELARRVPEGRSLDLIRADTNNNVR